MMTMDPWHVFTANFGTMPKPSTAFVTLLDIVVYGILAFNVSKARGKFEVKAPSTTGPEKFDRIYRAHQNTLEQLVLHLPLLWIAAYAMDDVFAAAFGAVWLFGRILYARGYYRKAKSRSKGFFICLGVNAILLACDAVSVLASL
ncbi:MAG TPA: MAPEG family protein [Alphaproteobacteria bacterium]|nr:MAPEG family protein [Alphaproteobacteria bacterium]